MRGYYGLNERGSVFIYFPYYFTGMSLNGTNFRFRFDFKFLERLSNSKLNLEDLSKKGWKIDEIDINHVFLDALLDSICFKSKDRTLSMANEIVEMSEDFVSNISRKKEKYDDGYLDMDTQEEYKEDKWWNLGLEPPFLSEDINWKEEDCQD